MRPAKSPDPVDKLIARNIRFYRIKRRLSQTALGERIGVTFQQVQKYEKASNRVSASRLAHIARVLNVPISALFDDTMAGEIGGLQTKSRP